MDPLTQGALGAALPQSLAQPARIHAAALVGLVAGMAPDLDVLIRSSEDPLLFLEYHRQFTHALVFIPVGALIVASVCHLLFTRRWQLPFRITVLFALLGYATHALLDACTSYGTQLLWPFSSHRFSWDTVSVVDPLLTLPLLMLVAAAAKWRRASLAALAVIWVISYQVAGYKQQQRAQTLAWEVAAQRGHAPTEIVVRPGFANILLWRSVYRYAGYFYADGIRAGLQLQLYPGAAMPTLDPRRDFPWLDPDSQQARDIERFNWFSQGYTAIAAETPSRILDVRYSLLPHERGGLWGIELSEDAGSTAHAAYIVSRDMPAGTLRRYWRMLRGL
ncbi:MAG: metal-dependent hydrolase [Gammaproteobacteria bacterium]|nr:metal-dependent hydrolase [Gammaproteobacteria bacterium]NND38650.1 metal-dependent hydrolase [Pseudomonadales bacterium]MBT8151618.1 metal-dependent hydrolase [Gammaproteobacteria bacterium]NNL11613.1 metal-dependent hydrolase [Pseudomonadales bacterium]NNM11728.1 metal-dependent hydrolase [Pseudomonadales bacterium]